MDILTMPYYYLSLILLFNILKSDATFTNETDSLSNEFRKPRVNGRIVKLYSGPKPQPFICPAEGFQPDPTNCAIFYRCVLSAGKFSVFKYQCAPGTVYDPQFEVCNYPQNTRRTECIGFLQVLDRLVTNSDNAKQDVPSKEIPKPISTKNPIYFDKPRATAAPSLLTTISKWLTDNQQTSGVKPTAQTTTSKIIIENNSKRGERSDPCTREGFVGDSEDCRKFYRCVSNNRGSFVKYEFSCSGAAIWDENTQNCNHAWAVRKRSCGSINLEETTVSNAEISNEVFYDDKIEKDNRVNYGSKVTNQGYPEHTENEKYHMDKEQIRPTYDNVVTSRPTQPFNNKEENNKIIETPTKQTASSNNKITNTRVDNTNECKETGFMADRKDCRKFYRCVDNGRGGFLKYEFTCSDGTAWDENLEACNYIGSVKSCDKSINYSEHSTQETENNPPPNMEENISQNNYGENIENNNESDQSNAVETTTTTAKTDSPTSSSIPDPNNDNIKCSSSGFEGDSKNCKVFYRCVDDGKGSYTKYKYKCGDGTVWDSSIEACNHEWAVKNCGANSEDDKNQSTSANPTTAVTTVSLVQVSSTPSSEIDDYYNEGYGQQQTPTNNTSNSNSNSRECTESGFMADIIDCQKFYRCVDDGRGGFTKYEFACGEGTIWDPSIEACNYEGQPKKCLRQGDNQNDENQEAGVDTTTTSFMTQENTELVDSGYGNPSLENNNEPSVGDSQDCKSEGFFGDKNDCQKFYRCVQNDKGGFTRHEFKCGEKTVWDQSITACNYENDNLTCSKSTSTQKPQSQTEIPHDKDKTTTSTTEKTSSSNSDSVCHAEGFFADPYDCQKFYRCVNNEDGGYIRYNFSCGEGTIWVQEIQACDIDDDPSRCNAHTTSTPTTTTKNPSISTTSTHRTTTIEINNNQTDETTSTPQTNDECSSEGFFPDKQDCTKFYRCVSNDNGGYIKYNFDCGEATAWDENIQACNYINEVDRCTTTQTQHDEPVESTTIIENNTQTIQSSSTTTEKSTSETTMTPNLNTTSSSTTSPSTTSNSTTTSTSSPSTTQSSNSCDKEGYYGDTKDCKKFYRCVDNGKGGFTKYDFDCGEGTIWDQDKTTCNHPQDVANPSCNKTQETSTTSHNSSQSESATSQGTTTSTESSSNSITTTSSTFSPSTNHSSDKCEKEGYYGDSKDCTKFYRCVNNGNGGFTKYEFDCGDGTIWDQDKITCNHPQDVVNPSCNSTQETTTSSSTKTTSSVTTSQSSSVTSQGTTTSTTESSTTQSSNCTDSTKKPSKNVTCEKAGYYSDPNDCKKFYRCVDWDGNGNNFSVFYFECGEGTIWDPAVETCNHEDSVYPPRDCSKSNQKENVTTESTTTAEGTTTEEITTTEESSTTDQTTTDSTATTTTSTKKPTSTTSTTTTKKPSSSATTTTTKKPTNSSTTTTTTKKPTSSTTTTTTKKPTSSTTTTTTKKPTSTTTTKKPTTSTTTTTTKKPTTSSTTTTTKKPTPSTTTTTTTTQQTTTAGTTEESTTTDATEQPTTTEESTTQTATTAVQTTQTTEQTEGTTQQTTTQGGSTTEDNSSTTTESNQETTTEDNSSENKDCPETDDDQYLYVCPTSFRRHPKYCNLFYQCDEDDESHEIKIANFRCPNNTIYDDKKSKCVEESKADKKCDGKIAQRRKLRQLSLEGKDPIELNRDSFACTTLGHFELFKNKQCSPAYLKCAKTRSGKIRGFVYQCPKNYVYWSISRRCERKSQIYECSNSTDIDWKDRREIPTERKNVAM